ncbi:MAG: HNH endonuclease family protein, partial [Allomuricauda sp.]
PREQQRVFNTIWNPIEENARDLLKQKSLVSDYIRDYLTLKNKKIPNKSKVYQEFKKNYPDKQDEGYMNELESMKALSMHYKMFVNPEIVKDSQIQKELQYVNRLEINVAYPFLLQVFEDWDNGIIEKEVVIQVLKLIQNYTWRRFVVGLPTNALNKIFMTLYSEIDTEEYYDSLAIALCKKRGNSRFPNNDDIVNALKDKDLYNIKAKNRNYLFELLENYKNREHVDTSNESITVEHIFPQNPSPVWSAQLSEEEFFVFKEKHLNTLANLTLSGNNGALGNKSFSEKKNMNHKDGRQGYTFSRLWLNEYLKSIEKWDNSSYESRFTILSNRFLAIWKYPDVEIPLNGENTELN